MKRLFTICLVGLLAVSATTSKAQQERLGLTPLQFNDQLSAITDSLYARGQQWGLKFNEANKTKNFASLAPSRKRLEQFINTSIARVKAMKDVNDSKDLRMAMIAFLEYERQMIALAFKPMESIGPSAGKEEVQAAIDKLMEYSQKESAELKKVGAAQEAYGAANGFRIAPPEEEAGKDKP